MTVMLKSLRITSELDGAPYAQGANMVVEANRRLIESDKQRGAALAQADAALQKLAPSLASISKALVPGYTEAARFNTELQRLANSFDRSTDVARYADLYERLAVKYNMVADAASLVAANHVKLAPVIEEVNRKLIAQVEIAERAARASAQQSAAQSYQTGINERLGVRTDFGTEARASDIAAYATEMDRLAARFDPLAAAAQTYSAQMAELGRALSVGAISQDAYARAANAAADVYEKAASKISAVTSAVGTGGDVVTKSARDSAQAFIAEAEAVERVTRELERRAAVAAEKQQIFERSLFRVDQSRINDLLGVRDAPAPGSAARQSAQVFMADQAAADATAELQMSIDRLRASLDPAEAAWQRFNAGVEEAKRLMAAHGDIDLYRRNVAALQQELQNTPQRQGGGGVSPQQLLGIGGAGRSARDSAAAFEEQAREVDRLSVAAKLLRLEIDPLGEAQRRLAETQRDLNQMQALGLITTDELAAGMASANTRFERTREYVGHIGTGVRLTQHELANLSYQFNDIAVMLASGQAPFMMLMQQGMQIGQIIGPQGLGGGVRALGSGIMSFLVNPINLAVIGLATAASAASYFFGHMFTGGEKIADMLTRHNDRLRELGDSYGEVGRRAAEISLRPKVVVEFEAEASLADAEKRLRSEVEKMVNRANLQPYAMRSESAAFAYLKVDPNLEMFRQEIDKISQGLKTGTADIDAFQARVVDMINLDPDNSGLQEAGANVIKYSAELAELGRTAEATRRALDPLQRAMIRRAALTSELIGTAPGNASLYSMIPDMRGPRQQLEDTYRAILANATGMEQVRGAAVLYQRALANLEEQQAKIVDLARLELDALNAKSPADKARIAAERERINMIGEAIDAEERNIRVVNAGRLAYEQAAAAIDEANRNRAESARDAVASLRLDIELQGRSAGAIAEAKANWQAFLDLRQQAEQNGIAFDTAQLNRLKDINAELGRLSSLQTMRAAVPDMRSPRQRIEDEYLNAVENADTMGQITEATDARAKALEYLNAETAKSVALARLELEAISARSPADKARIAAERERIAAMNTAADAMDVDIKAQNAAAQAYAQATFAITEQNRTRLRAANDNLRQARLEANLVGATQSEQMEARANLQAYLDLQRQAEDNGIAFDTAQLERLKAINAELAALNHLVAERKMAFDIGEERRLLGMTGREGEIYKRLTGAGIAAGSDAFERLAEDLRELHEIEQSFGYGFRRGFEDATDAASDFASTTRQAITGTFSQLEDGWVNFAKTGKIELDDLYDHAIEFASKLAWQFAMSGLMNLAQDGTGGFNLAGLFGLPSPAVPSLYAAGGAFHRGEVHAFARGGAFMNTVVSQPTYFAYGAGDIGMMGEAGPEAVMPLRRMASGKLGVEAMGGGGGVVVNFAPVTHVDARGAAPGMAGQLARMLDQRDEAFRRQLPALVRDARQRSKV